MAALTIRHGEEAENFEVRLAGIPPQFVRVDDYYRRLFDLHEEDFLTQVKVILRKFGKST
jgi:hypothetical protein